MFGLPTAATTMSAPRHSAGRSRVRLCATVTVAFAASSRAAIYEEHAAGGRARHERITGRAGAELADIDVVKTIDILRRQDRLRHPLLVDMRGERQLHENAVDRGIGV
jgi:hypothetical protein